jgi:hypothetical protein
VTTNCMRNFQSVFLAEGSRFPSHIIIDGGIKVDPGNISEILNWKQPTDVSKIRSFLRLVGYYRRFIEASPK